MSHHLTQEQLERYVIGALGGPDEAEVERHVSRCGPCAAQLQKEAAVEVSLTELAEHVKTVRVIARHHPRRWAGPALAASAVAALAAGTAMVVLRDAASLTPEPRVVQCEEPQSASECIERASFDGLLSVGPGRRLEVPRYDEQPGRRGTP